MNYTALVTTSGTGSRLKDLTQNTNKALIDIAGKPAIDYIFQNYPPTTKYVITLGYLGDQVRKYLTKHYPKLIFEFVTVSPYQGEGSSLGFSMLAAESRLQEPFIFHCCDTIVTGPLPLPTKNWNAGFTLTGDISHYRTLTMTGDSIVTIADKGVNTVAPIHIGLVGIYHYVSFWHALRQCYSENPSNQALNDTDVINQMLKDGQNFEVVSVTNWFDTGNPEALKRTKQALINL